MSLAIYRTISNCKTGVRLEGDTSIDALVEYANGMVIGGAFSTAGEIYDEVLKRAPSDYRGHWGKLLSELKIMDMFDSTIEMVVRQRFSSVINDTDDVRGLVISICSPYFDNAICYAPKDVKVEYLTFFDNLLKTALGRKEWLFQVEQAHKTWSKRTEGQHNDALNTQAKE